MNLGAESEQVEFKRSTGEHREAMESIASILNKHGSGVLYFGVRNDGEVTGQDIRRRIVIDGSPTREEIPEIPREAIREAVINAFCHKEHQGDSRVMIDIFTDTVQITNPGLFPAGTTPDDYLMGVARAPQSRNPRIADALFRGGYIEAFGSGLRRIKQACDEAGVSFEYFQEGNATRVAFHRPGSHVELVSSGNSNEADAKIGRENRTRKSDAKIGRRQPIAQSAT